MNDKSIFTKLNDTLNDPHHLDKACQEIIRFALRVSKADYCTLTIINPINNQVIRVFTQKKETSEEFVSADKDKILLYGIDQKILNKNDVISINVDLRDRDNYNDLFSTSGQLESIVTLRLLAPRSEHKKILGQLYLGYKRKCKNIELEMEFGKRIAKEAASALQHTWSIRRYKEVAEIGREINKELKSPKEIFERLVQYLPKILNSSDFFMMGVYKQEAEELDFYLLEKNEPRDDPNCRLEGACEYVIKNKEAVFIHNYKKEKSELDKQGFKVVHRNKKERKIPNSMMFVPLNIREITLGVLSVQQNKINAFDKEDRQILDLLSHFVALALSNLRWKQGLESLIKTGQELTQKLDTVNSMQHVVDLIREQSNADIVSLHPYDYRLDRFVFPIIYSGQFKDKRFSKPEYPVSDDTATLVKARGEPLFCKSSELYKKLGGNIKTRRGTFETREDIESVAALPLLAGRKPVGILFLNFRREQLFTDSQKNMIEGLALFVAISIINSSAFQDANRRILNNSETLRKIDRKIIETNERKEIFDAILSTTRENLENKDTGKAHGTILIYDQRKNALIVESHVGDNEQVRQGKPIFLADKKGLTYHAWKRQTTIRVGNVKKDNRYLRIDETTKSEIVTPIIQQRKAIGVISFESNREDFFTKEDEEFLKTVSNQVLVSIKQTDAFKSGQKAKENELAAGLIAQQIIEAQLDFKEVVQSILDKCLELTNSNAGAILLHDRNRKDFEIGAGRNIREEKKTARLPDNKGLSGWAIRNKKTFMDNVKKTQWKKIHEPWIRGVEWALVAPMLKGREKIPVGVIAIEGKSKFTEADIQLVEEMANLAVIAFDRQQKDKDLVDAANTFETLNDVGHQLGEIIDMDSVQRAYEIVGKRLQKEESVQVVIRRYEWDTQELQNVWQANENPKPFKSISIKDDEAIKKAFKERIAIRIPDTDNPAAMKLKLADKKIKSLVIAWITFQGKNYGSISLSHRRNNYFRGIQLRLIEGSAQLLGLTLYRLEAEEENRDLDVVGSIGQIGGDLAHDIISLYAIPNDYESRLQEGILSSNEEKDNFIKEVVTDIAGVLEKSSQVLDFYTESKANNRELIDTGALFNEIKSAKRVKHQGIKLRWRIGKNLGQVRVVKSHIFQIIQNLINNSVDEMPEGGTIIISTTRRDNAVQISVSDTGKGIAPENMEKIFSRYSTKKDNHFGYGLWSSRRYARLNEGKLKGDNNKSGGAVFTLNLPVSKT